MLSFNTFHHLPVEHFALTLSTLLLARNRLTSVPDAISRLTALTVLDLSDNTLETLTGSIGALTRLTTLGKTSLLLALLLSVCSFVCVCALLYVSV